MVWRIKSQDTPAERLRRAKDEVKAFIKASGSKPSWCKASEITEMANMLLANKAKMRKAKATKAANVRWARYRAQQ